MNLKQILVSALLMSAFCAVAQAGNSLVSGDSGKEQDDIVQIVESSQRVTLQSKWFGLPEKPLRYRWTQLSGPRVSIKDNTRSDAYFVAPSVEPEQVVQLVFQLSVIDSAGYDFLFTHAVNVLAPQPHVPPALVTQRNANEILIPAKYHPLGSELVAVIHLPDNASAQNPVPGCAIVHGSGGLFKEVQPGQSCSAQVESVYQGLSDQLVAQGVATIMPSSFYSRDHRFCEDNDNDYLAYGASPFFNGDDTIARDDGYKIRRVAIRTMDLLATMSFFCDLDEVDCNKSCMVGTSNGGTAIMAYNAQSLPKDLLEFMDDAKRPFEYNSTQQKRNAAFANFPALTQSPITLKYNLTHRPLPKFAQLVSPGCSLRDLVPHIDPDSEDKSFGLNELYYPAETTALYFELGSEDTVPAECYLGEPIGVGDREIQARYFEQQSAIAANDSQYLIHLNQGGGHSLLSDPAYKDDIKERLDDLVSAKLAP